MQLSAYTRSTNNAARCMALLLSAYVVLVLPGCSLVGMGTSTSPPVTVPAVIQMSKAGVPADTIITKMRESGTAYRLTAAQLAQLHEQGVPDAVLDYMQQTYLAAVRHDQARADWNGWTWADDGYWYGGWAYGWPLGWSADEDEGHEARAFDHEHLESGEHLAPHEHEIEGHAGKR